MSRNALRSRDNFQFFAPSDLARRSKVALMRVIHFKEVFMSDHEECSPVVNRAELATIFEVSLPTVDAWVRKGCPVVERGGRGRDWQFYCPDVFNWRVLSEVAARVAAAR